MMELIDRSMIPNYKIWGVMTVGDMKQPTEVRVVQWDDLMKMPIVKDLEPVRHGSWLLRGGRFRCSVCDGKALWRCDGGTGCWSHEYTQAKSVRCPHCGAKMDMKS